MKSQNAFQFSNLRIMTHIRTALMMAAITLLASCTSWNRQEKAIIDQESSVIRVLTINDRADSLVLRTECKELSKADLKSQMYYDLKEKMVATVTSPEQDGVGIAGPQIGICRRVVAVQRFDKAGEPFEVYPNIRITETFGEKKSGAEGCLSVPGKRGMVQRFQKIRIEYTSDHTYKDTTELVEGFTAVIFQHETDHLDGIIYTDRIEYVN